MIKKNNGTVLVVTVISVFILTMIGFVSVEMFVSQNVLVMTDIAKIKTFYAADGVVEMLRGYINKTYPERAITNDLDVQVPLSGNWVGGTNPINTAISTGYDTTRTFPVVCASVELRRVASPPSTYVDFSTTTTVQYYRIMGVSSVTVNSNVIYSTVSYYFYVSSITPGGVYRKRFAAWREHKIIENDNWLVQ